MSDESEGFGKKALSELQARTAEACGAGYLLGPDTQAATGMNTDTRVEKQDTGKCWPLADLSILNLVSWN